MATAFPTAALVLAAAACLGAPRPAAAYEGFVAPLDEIPVTTPLIGSARAVGMGGAGIAAAEDASAIDLNPAALARMRRVEFSGGLAKSSDDLSGTALGNEFSTQLSRTSLSSVRFAYPFPTYRGSLVVGISGRRVLGFDDDFYAAYEDSVTWEESPGVPMTAPWAQVEDQISEGGLTAWTLAGAFDASPTVSLGASVSYWTGDFTRRFVWTAEDDTDASGTYDSYVLQTASEADVSGVRAALGGLVYVTEALSLGAVIETPITLTFEGAERVVERRVYEDFPPGEFESVTYFSDELELPFTFSGGVSWTPTDLLEVAADVVYTDWSEMTYEGFLYLEDDPSGRARAYEATTDVRLGVEATLPSWPLRLRAGYMTRPVAYRGLDVDRDRSYFTLGAGVLVDTVFAVDVAWMTGSWDRSADGYDYDESVSDDALLLEAAYRF
jgi:long-subunit fatty acid transport protein